VIQNLEDFDLVDEEFGLFDVFFGNFLDSPPWPVDVFLLGLVNDSISASAEFLYYRTKYLGMKIVAMQDVVLTGRNEIFLLNYHVWLLHVIYL
jgi:hypothetical protein